MKIINDGLSEPLYHAIVRYNESYQRTGYLSTTSCLQPPRKRILEQRHDSVLVLPATSFLDSFIGGAGHAAIDGAHPTGLHEKEFTTEVCGVVFSGRPDIVLDGEVGDWKFTKTWSYLFSGGMKDEWHWQGNINSWLVRLSGMEVKRSWVELVFLDWSREEAKRNHDYPQKRVMRVSPAVLSDAEVSEFVTRRVELHLAAECFADEDLPRCTPEEQWARPDKWAVMRPGQKRAVKVFDNEQDAEKHLRSLYGYKVEHRPGRKIRCESYCPAQPVCSQYMEGRDDET